MRTSAIIAIFSATAAYAIPYPQHGRWQPEWETNNKANVAPSNSSIIVAPTTSAISVAPSTSSSTAPPTSSSSTRPPTSTSITPPTTSSNAPPKSSSFTSSTSTIIPPKSSSSTSSIAPTKPSSSSSLVGPPTPTSAPPKSSSSPFVAPPASSSVTPSKSSAVAPPPASSPVVPPKSSSSSVAPPKVSSAAPPPPANSAPAPAASSAAPLGNPNAAPNPAPNAALVASLLNAPSASSRIVTLNEAVKAGTADFKFDFNPAANPGTPGLGGEVILANRANFPPLVGLGVAFATLWFEPCGLNTPHIHPRATEVLTLVTKGTLTGGFVFDNTFNMEVSENLTQFQGMVFPQGSIHYQFNNECYPQVAIAGFSDEDPSSSSIAQNFFAHLRDDVTLAALGFPSQITPQNFNDLQASIPRSFAMGIQNCYAKCGITPPSTTK